MKLKVVQTLIALLVLAGCASEDPNIVNPPPGNARIALRLLNMVPDDVNRKLLLDLGYQTQFVGPGKIGDSVRAPADSSFLEIIGDTSEFRTPVRYRFVQQSIYDVVAVGKANSADNRFDTIMVSNANQSLTTLPVAQMRLLNAYPDTTQSFDVRIGCPNGTPLSPEPIGFKQTSLYSELPPGQNVLTLLSVNNGVSTIINTFECTLDERTPYTILLYPKMNVPEPQIVLYSEADFSGNPERPFTPVSARNADIRVCNVGSSNVTVNLVSTGQELASGLPPATVNSYLPSPTCEYEQADIFNAEFSDGRSASDSTSLVVRGKFTIITADSGASAGVIIVPPMPTVYGASGKAIVRVAHAAASSASMNVSVGARTSASSTNGISTGIVLTPNISFDQVSDPVSLEPGEIPLTVGTASPPSSILLVGRTNFEPNHNYLLLLANESDGSPILYVMDEMESPGPLNKEDDAALVRFVNGISAADYAVVSVGTTVQNGKIYYRNSLVTSIQLGSVPVSVGAINQSVVTQKDKRTLLVYAIKNGEGEKLIEITSDPLRQIPNISDRRVINATADIDFVSASYDTNFRINKPSEIVADRVPFGESSAVYTLERDRRGTMYFYDAVSEKDIYSLPIDFGPLGNSYSLVVTGRKEDGYEVIVLQEF